MVLPIVPVQPGLTGLDFLSGHGPLPWRGSLLESWAFAVGDPGDPGASQDVLNHRKSIGKA